MNYDNLNDNELIFMVKEQDEDAQNILYNKYYYLIRKIINKYQRTCYAMGIDIKDLIQESLIAFYSAINNYNDYYNTNFKTYLTLCIDRKINNTIRHYNTNKEKVLTNYITIDKIEELNLSQKISDNNKNNPLVLINELESLYEKIMNIKDELSKQELDVFLLMIKGYTIKEISSMLNITYKGVNSTITRIRKKLKNNLYLK